MEHNERKMLLDSLDSHVRTLTLLDRLTNILQIAEHKDVKEIAYLMHEIIEAWQITDDIYEKVAKWKIVYK